MKKNRYSQALKHLKSTKIDEKIQRLNETPTNNMSGVYSLNDPGFRLGGINDQDPERVFYADVNGNWSAGVPGTPGELTYTRPRGYWDYGPGTVPAVQTTETRDFITVSGVNGSNTDNFIRSSDGFVLADLPPGTRNFILGPLVDAYALNHGSYYNDDYTNIGYIQKDTRQFVLLGRIPGTWSKAQSVTVGNYTSTIWDGTATGFISYNANFTLEHALWFRQKMLSGKYTAAVPYKYSGGIPQFPDPNNPGFYNGNIPDDGKAGGLNDNQGTKQKDPKKGGPGDASLWGLNYKTGKKEKLSAKDYAAYKAGGGDAAAKKGKSIDQIIAQGKKNLGQYDSGPKKTSMTAADFGKDIFGMSNYSAYKAGGGDAAVKSGKTVQQVIDQGKQNIVQNSQKNTWKDPDTWAKNPLKALDSLVGDLMLVGPGAGSNSIKVASTIKALQAAQATSGSIKAANIIKNMPGEYTAAKGTGAISPPKVKVNGKWVDVNSPAANGNWTAKQIWNTKTGKYETITNKDPGWDWAQRTLTDPLFKHYTKTGEMPSGLQGWNIPKAFTPAMVKTGPTPAATATLKGAATGTASLGILNAGQAKGQVAPQLPADLKTKIDKGETLTNKDFDALKQYMDSQKSQGQKPQQVDSLSKISNVSSPEAKSLADQLSNVKPGSSKESLLKKQAVKLIDKLSPNDPSYNKLLNLLAPTKFSGIKESSILTESHRKILREIKQPIKVEEPPVQKLKKYKPNFAGKYTAQNTPDVTASKQSDDMVAAKNAAGQSWKAEDKYWKGYETTERMNIIYDQVGHGDQAWNMVMDEIQNKRRWMNRDIQEKLNIIAHEKAMRKEDPDYESPFMNIIKEQETLKADKDPLFKKVSKRLKTEIDYPDKPSKLGYPNDPPPKMIDGWHPDYGQKDDYYNKLDPDSANSMPSTGNTEIDAKVKRAKTLKKVLGKKA